MKQHYDRGAICRRAHQLKRERGIPFGEAMRMSWAEAKGQTLVVATPRNQIAMNTCQQAGGVQATLARYGLTADRMERLAGRAVAVIREIAHRAEDALLTAIARKEQNIAALRDERDVVSLKRNADGVYEL